MANEIWSYAFLVGLPADHHSMIWRLSCDRHSNIYLYVRQSGCLLPIKTTFHPPTERWPSGRRHEGLTAEFVRKSGLPKGLGSRFVREWSGDTDLGTFGMLAYRLLFPASQLTRFPIPTHPGRPVKWFEPPPAGHTYIFDLLFRGDEARDQFKSWDGAKCAHIDAWRMPDDRFFHVVAHIVPDRPFGFDNTFLDMIGRLHDVRATDPERFARMRIAAWTTADGIPACADIAAEGVYRSVITNNNGNVLIPVASFLHKISQGQKKA